MANKPVNIQWLDTLRALAMLGVIMIHVSSPLVHMTYGRNMPYWWIGNVLDSAVRFAVPLFLMLSGATLLAKEYRPGEFYKRRFSRVLVPFLFWIVAYWVYRWFVLLPREQPHEMHDVLQWAAKLFLKEGVSKHFWYIYMILFIYLFVPFLGKAIQKLSMSAVSFILLLWVVLTFACKGVPLNLYDWSGQYASKLLGYFLHSGYLVLGYYLMKLPVVYPAKIRIWAALVFIVSVTVSAGGTYFFSQSAHKLDLSLYGYLSINTMIQSIAIFMWLKDSWIENRLANRSIETVSNYSYGIYLAHILVIGIFFQYNIFWTMAHPLISVPALIVLVLACSFAIIYLLRKIPLGKYIAG